MRHFGGMYFSKLLLADILAFGSSRGADKMDLCRRIGIELPPHILPEEQVSYETMATALSLTAKEIDDAYLGLHLGERMMIKAKDQVDAIMNNSPSIEAAFANAVTFSKLISDALRSSMTKEDEFTRVSFEVNPDWAVLPNFAVQQIIDMTLVCTMQSIYLLSQKKYFPTAVHFNNPSLTHKNEYYRVFNCCLKFNEATPAIIFRNQILNQALPAPNPGLLAALKREADLELTKMPSATPLIIQVKEIILNTLPHRSNIKEIASSLHLSARTLQRKLRQLQTTFKAIEKDLLLKLAKKLLVHEERSIDEIAYLLGFSAGSALIRFFKNEMNVSPKKYKNLILPKS